MAFFEKRYHPPGTAPGTLTEVHADDASPLQIRLIDFDKDQLTLRENIEAATLHISFCHNQFDTRIVFTRLKDNFDLLGRMQNFVYSAGTLCPGISLS